MPLLFTVFLIKIAIIKKKSNLSYSNINQKPFTYCLIMPSPERGTFAILQLIPQKESLDARNLCAVPSNKQQ